MLNLSKQIQHKYNGKRITYNEKDPSKNPISSLPQSAGVIRATLYDLRSQPEIVYGC